jgi:DNA helicase II / ATP-dependent DNA helicase PcrA
LSGPPTATLPAPGSARSDPGLEGLTAEQASAVAHGEGPLFVKAGPGSGKTTVLIRRGGRLITSGLARPEEILVLAFTNQAGRECAQRIGRLLGEQARGITACTFHALCARILRDHPRAVRRRRNFTIYDEHDVHALVDYVIADESRAPVQTQLEQLGRCRTASIAEQISLAKNRLLTPEGYAAADRRFAPLIAAVWRELAREMRASNAVDFDDLLCLCAGLLRADRALRRHYRRRWRWVLVDEAQDLTYAQLALLWLLGGPDGNLTVVADADQSLYPWRGADPRNLARFAAAFPARREITLSVNFRSRAEIVAAATRLIDHQPHRQPIQFTAARGPGGQLCARAFTHEYAEAALIARQIKEQLARGTPPGEIMVIARTAYGLQPTLSALVRAGVPHRVLGSLGLYERAVAKDALAYLTLLSNPDDMIALRRAICVPRRGAGTATVAEIVAHARAQNLDLPSACAHAGRLPRARPGAREGIAAFGRELLALREQHEAGRPLAVTVEAVLRMKGGLVEHHTARSRTAKGKRRREAKRALEDLDLLVKAAHAYERQQAEASLHGFLEQALGLHGGKDDERREDLVKVSTVHAAKGLQASVVFQCAAEEPRTDDTAAERSVQYVALTRARDAAYISWSSRRGERATRGRSRFITEAGL